MTIRKFTASVVKGGAVSTSTDAVAAAFADADAKVVLALAQTDIDASVAAEAAVAAIKTAYDAGKAELNSTVYSSTQPVTVVLNGSLTVNQVRLAFENILNNLKQSSEFPEN